MALVKFMSGDGVEHEVEETSLAAGVMRDHGFQLVEGDCPAGLAKMNRDALIDEAAKLGITIDADDKSQTKAVIIAAIEAKQAEEPQVEDPAAV